MWKYLFAQVLSFGWHLGGGCSALSQARQTANSTVSGSAVYVCMWPVHENLEMTSRRVGTSPLTEQFTKDLLINTHFLQLHLRWQGT